MTITVSAIMNNETGMHARPASMLVQKAKDCSDSVITLEKDGKTVKATAMLQIMTLGIQKGDVINITVTGGNEQMIADDIKNFIETLHD